MLTLCKIFGAAFFFAGLTSGALFCTFPFACSMTIIGLIILIIGREYEERE